MPWYLTTPRQIKGFKREQNRVDEALSRQDVRGVGSPLARLRGAMGISAAFAVLILIGAGVMSVLSPKPDNSLAQIVVTRDGGRFVQFNGRLHRVSNLASARLIVGSPNQATVVGKAALALLPSGPPMGIPNAPDLLEPRTDSSAVWTICDWHDTAVSLSLLRSGGISTAVIAGADLIDGGEDLAEDRAVLVRPSNDPSQLWLVYRDTRAQVGRDDFAAQAALGLTPARISAAMTVSPALLAAIGASPALTAPNLTDRGKPSPVVAGSSIGDILTVGTAAGTRAFYLVGHGGVQLIGAVLAQLMVNTGSAQKLLADPSTVQSLPRAEIVAEGRFPSRVPVLTSEPALCWSWSKSRDELTARVRVFTAAKMPLTEVGRRAAVSMNPNYGSQPQANVTVTRPGFGWYARVTGDSSDSVAAEQLLWIDPDGTRFPIDAVVPVSKKIEISYDPTVKALGLNTVAPTPIPWAVAKLYAPGPTLSIKNAQVMQGQIEPVSQIPSPSLSPGVASPSPVPGIPVSTRVPPPAPSAIPSPAPQTSTPPPATGASGTDPGS